VRYPGKVYGQYPAELSHVPGCRFTSFLLHAGHFATWYRITFLQLVNYTSALSFTDKISIQRVNLFPGLHLVVVYNA